MGSGPECTEEADEPLAEMGGPLAQVLRFPEIVLDGGSVATERLCHFRDTEAGRYDRNVGKEDSGFDGRRFSGVDLGPGQGKPLGKGEDSSGASCGPAPAG